MKKGANAPQALKFKRAIKKRVVRAKRKKNPVYRKPKEVFTWTPLADVPKLPWWKRLLKFLHIL